MKLILASSSAALLGMASAYRDISTDTLEQLSFKEWKDHHGIKFSSVGEDAKREANFIEMKDFVINHNNKYKSEDAMYYTSLNRFAAMKNDEFLSKYTMRDRKSTKSENPTVGEEMEQYVCEYVWSNTTHSPVVNNIATVIKNQGQCGSCYTFATAASIEGQVCKNPEVNCAEWEGVSTQQFLDCSDNNSALDPYEDDGCGGGWPANVYHYVFAYQNGFESWSDYPYMMDPDTDAVLQEACEYEANLSIGTFTQCGNIEESGNQDQIMSAVEYWGATAIQMDASGEGFQMYAGGVYDGDVVCQEQELDHAITITGFGVYDYTPTTTVKNSWGTAWGVEGYFYLIRDGTNTCGAYTYAQYPVGLSTTLTPTN